MVYSTIQFAQVAPEGMSSHHSNDEAHFKVQEREEFRLQEAIIKEETSEANLEEAEERHNIEAEVCVLRVKLCLDNSTLDN